MKQFKALLKKEWHTNWTTLLTPPVVRGRSVCNWLNRHHY